MNSTVLPRYWWERGKKLALSPTASVLPDVHRDVGVYGYVVGVGDFVCRPPPTVKLGLWAYSQPRNIDEKEVRLIMIGERVH